MNEKIYLNHLFNIGDQVDHVSIPGKKGGTIIELREDWPNMRVDYLVQWPCACTSQFCEDELKKAEE